MTANLATASIKALNATTSRPLATQLGEIVNVKNFGALGDGSTNDAPAIQSAFDYAYGTSAAPHGGNIPGVNTNKAVFFPGGDYRISTEITMTSVMGARVYGAGRFTTRIQNVTANGSVFVTNGCAYSIFDGMYLVSNGTGKCFDLDWDNLGTVALQSNTFSNMYFEAGAYGVRIGETGHMGSENVFLNCYFAGNSTAGIATRNGNALANCVFGGNFASCGRAIHVTSVGGSVPIIHGVSFQNQVTTDIEIEWSADDMYSIHGCRQESTVTNTTFIILHSGVTAHIGGCTHKGDGPCTFLFIEAGSDPRSGPGVACVDGCASFNGIFVANGNLYIRGNPARFRPIAITGAASNGGPNLIRLAVTDTSAWTTGQSHWVAGITGTGNVSALNNNPFTVTVIDPTHIDLQGTTFSGSWISGGVVDGQAFGNPNYLASFAGLVVENI